MPTRRGVVSYFGYKLAALGAYFLQLTSDGLRRIHAGLQRTLDERFSTHGLPHSYLADDGYFFQFDTEEEVDQAITADIINAAADRDMVSTEDYIWVLNAKGLREVFAIAREEADDDVALLTLAANTEWQVASDGCDEEDGDDWNDSE